LKLSQNQNLNIYITIEKYIFVIQDGLSCPFKTFQNFLRSFKYLLHLFNYVCMLNNVFNKSIFVRLKMFNISVNFYKLFSSGNFMTKLSYIMFSLLNVLFSLLKSP